jgi:hypothetical protein
MTGRVPPPPHTCSQQTCHMTMQQQLVEAHRAGRVHYYLASAPGTLRVPLHQPTCCEGLRVGPREHVVAEGGIVFKIVPVHPKQVWGADVLLEPPVLKECSVSKHAAIGQAQLQHEQTTTSDRQVHVEGLSVIGREVVSYQGAMCPSQHECMNGRFHMCHSAKPLW